MRERKEKRAPQRPFLPVRKTLELVRNADRELRDVRAARRACRSPSCRTAPTRRWSACETMAKRKVRLEKSYARAEVDHGCRPGPRCCSRRRRSGVQLPSFILHVADGGAHRAAPARLPAHRPVGLLQVLEASGGRPGCSPCTRAARCRAVNFVVRRQLECAAQAGGGVLRVRVRSWPDWTPPWRWIEPPKSPCDTPAGPKRRSARPRT